jgi:hypothetical protein
MAEPGLIELWHYRTERCCVTPHDGKAPFVVRIYSAKALVSERAFDLHMRACEYAVEELRRVTSHST